MKEVVPFWVLSFIGHRDSPASPSGSPGTSPATHNLRPRRRTTLLVNAANLISFAILWIVKFLIFNKLFHIDPVEYEEHHAENGGTSECRRPGLSARGVAPAGDDPSGRVQSRKLLNCSGIPKSSALHFAITAWRSSRFLPVTRS